MKLAGIDGERDRFDVSAIDNGRHQTLATNPT
jgi:hypothetical protein